MTTPVDTDIVIRRSDRGLSVAGTRITLYDILDYLRAGWSSQRIRDLFGLTEEQIAGVLAYINAHRAEVESEYVQVLQTAEENRRYWEEQNRERLARIAQSPPPPGREALYAELQRRRAERGGE